MTQENTQTNLPIEVSERGPASVGEGRWVVFDTEDGDWGEAARACPGYKLKSDELAIRLPDEKAKGDA